MRDEAPVLGVRGSAAMRRLANPVTLCESHSAFFLAASGQIRMPQALRRRPAPSSVRMTSARRVRSVLTNSGPGSRRGTRAQAPPLDVTPPALLAGRRVQRATGLLSLPLPAAVPTLQPLQGKPCS